MLRGIPLAKENVQLQKYEKTVQSQKDSHSNKANKTLYNILYKKTDNFETILFRFS